MKQTYPIPDYVVADVQQHARDVERYLAGELSSEHLKALRVPRGIYEQRQDGLFMVRVRVAGGFLRASQARKLAELSRTYADGKIHVTTRQDLQLHQVRIEDTHAILQQLLQVGLTSSGGGGNTVRNITACSHGGIDQAEVFNTQPYALALTNYLLPFKSSYNLPRKFKIAFSSCSNDCTLTMVADIGFQARLLGGRRGFAVYVAGGLGAISRVGDLFKEFIPAEDTLRLAEAVKRVFIQYGDRRNRHRSRLRFLPERLGKDEFFRRLEEEVQQVFAEGVPDLVPVEVEDILTPGSQRPAAEEGDLADLENWKQYAVRLQRQKGYVAAAIVLERGDIAAESLEFLAELSELHGGSQIRTDRRQNLVIPHIPSDHLTDVYLQLKEKNLSQVGIEPLLISCKGAAACRLGICRSQELNSAIAWRAEKDGLDPQIFKEVEIHTSGCPNNCGQHSIAPLGFFGTARRQGGHSYPCYAVVAGGQTGEQRTLLAKTVTQLPARFVPDFAVELLKDFQSSPARTAGFPAYLEQEGGAVLQKLAQRYAAVPSYDEQRDFYRDWGCCGDFSLAGRGPGECGAGIFELIAQELNRAEKSFAAAQEAADDNQKAEKLLTAVVLAAGALLVTRGLEPGNSDLALKGFEQHFIDTGLAAKDHLELLVLTRTALRGREQLLADEVGAVRSFLDCVQELYDSMDASLSFPVESGQQLPVNSPVAAGKKKASGTGTADRADQELNLRGVACPMNFVYAKIALEQLERGQLLDIILDEGEPVNNVPASFKSQGQDVIYVTPEDDQSFRVRVRRVE